MSSAQSSCDSRPVNPGIFIRVARNARWLLLGEGGTRLVQLAAKVALARYLTKEGFGALSVAQASATYAVLAVDLGLSVFAQAEAARSGPQRLAELADEIVSVRALIGIPVCLLFALVSGFFAGSWTVRVTFAFASVYIIGEAFRTDWLLRGRERFDLVALARVFEAASFLAWVIVVGSRPTAVPWDALGWGLSGCVLAAVWLVMIPKILRRRITVTFQFRKWFKLVRESIFLTFTNAVHSALWLIPLWLLVSFFNEGEAARLAAPYGLVTSLVNLGSYVVMAFYPTSASLFQESQPQFLTSRRDLWLTMAMIGLPVAVSGSVVATPLVVMLFGHKFASSGPVFGVLMWLVPIRYIRMLYGTSFIATGFQRAQPIAPFAGLLVTGILAIPAIHGYSAVGAAVTILASECVSVVVSVPLAKYLHGDGSIPALGRLLPLVAINLALAAVGLLMVESLGRFGWILYLVVAGLVYPVALSVTKLLDPLELIASLREAPNL